VLTTRHLQKQGEILVSLLATRFVQQQEDIRIIAGNQTSVSAGRYTKIAASNQTIATAWRDFRTIASNSSKRRRIAGDTQTPETAGKKIEDHCQHPLYISIPGRSQPLNMYTRQNPRRHVILLKTSQYPYIQYVHTLEEICLLVCIFMSTSILGVVQLFRYVFFTFISN
jgi:hypothetical protein